MMDPYCMYENPMEFQLGVPSYLEPPPSLDIRIHMYMARNQMGYQRNPPNKNSMGWHGYGADDHWLKYCPKVEKKFKPPQRFCEEYLFRHLP